MMIMILFPAELTEIKISLNDTCFYPKTGSYMCGCAYGLQDTSNCAGTLCFYPDRCLWGAC